MVVVLLSLSSVLSLLSLSMTGGRQGTEVSGPGSNYGGLISGNHRAVRVTVG